MNYINKAKIKLNSSNQNTHNENINNKSFKIKNNNKINPLKFLICNINKKKFINNKIYYLNVNETTSCETFINKVFYKRHNSFIDDIVLEKIERPKKENIH